MSDNYDSMTLSELEKTFTEKYAEYTGSDWESLNFKIMTNIKELFINKKKIFLENILKSNVSTGIGSDGNSHMNPTYFCVNKNSSIKTNNIKVLNNKSLIQLAGKDMYISTKKEISSVGISTSELLENINNCVLRNKSSTQFRYFLSETNPTLSESSQKVVVADDASAVQAAPDAGLYRSPSYRRDGGRRQSFGGVIQVEPPSQALVGTLEPVSYTHLTLPTKRVV